MESNVTNIEVKNLLQQVKACTLCKDDIPLPPKPILQLSQTAKVLIVGQAPGRITHEKGIPFDDPSGRRLRSWMGIDDKTFYDANKIAILPMAFCFPGTGKSGDLAPPKQCAITWREQLLAQLKQIEVVLVIGQYAMNWHMDPIRFPVVEDAGEPTKKSATLTSIVANWQAYGDGLIPLPHPSPRNNIWLKKNPWFETDLLPDLQVRIETALSCSNKST